MLKKTIIVLGIAIFTSTIYANSFKTQHPLAEQGDAQAQYQLGMIYLKGLGVPKDSVKAIQWLKKSAEQGYINAQYTLGKIYVLTSMHNPQDKKQAIQWLTKAGKQGHRDAINLLMQIGGK